MDSCIRTFKEHMHLELEPPKMPGVVGCKRGATSPKLSPRSSPRLFRKLMVNKSIRQRRRFTVAHTCRVCPRLCYVSALYLNAFLDELIKPCFGRLLSCARIVNALRNLVVRFGSQPQAANESLYDSTQAVMTDILQCYQNCSDFDVIDNDAICLDEILRCSD
ncbi:hypothetical protein GOODEAATRI_023337 [Goodea atripinnis]|uniref:Uncharacterized protein n=1 Tax=Goodea atripinnis TaxID=208336 RepID=A0ABV0NX18_9TELE